MTTPAPPLELLTWTEICEQYPNSWVMIGYPETEYNLPKDTRKGIVLYIDEDADTFQAYSIENTPLLLASKVYRLYADRYTGKKKSIADKKLTIDFKKQLLMLA
jgi:hypothetical protein